MLRVLTTSMNYKKPRQSKHLKRFHAIAVLYHTFLPLTVKVRHLPGSFLLFPVTGNTLKVWASKQCPQREKSMTTETNYDTYMAHMTKTSHRNGSYMYKCQVLSCNSDGSLTQTDDIHSVKLLGTSLLVHVAYAANELAALHIHGWLAFTRAFCSSTCIDLLWDIVYAICTAAVCPKYSKHCIDVCTGSSTCTCFAAAAIIYNYSNNQQQAKYINIVISIAMLKSSKSCK